MTKTNDKYTYEDFLLKKRTLKKEIRDLENMVSSPALLGFIGNSVKDKVSGIVKNPALLDLAVDTGIGVGIEKVISKVVNKHSIMGRAVLIASAYLIPLVINQSKKIIAKRRIEKE